MSTKSITMTTNTTTFVANLTKPRATDFFIGSIIAFGTFGSGTLKFQLSPDGGTTKIDMKDMSGTVYSTTSNDVVSFQIAGAPGGNSDQWSLYAVLSGATSPSITVELQDNR